MKQWIPVLIYELSVHILGHKKFVSAFPHNDKEESVPFRMRVINIFETVSKISTAANSAIRCRRGSNSIIYVTKYPRSFNGFYTIFNSVLKAHFIDYTISDVEF